MRDGERERRVYVSNFEIGEMEESQRDDRTTDPSLDEVNIKVSLFKNTILKFIPKIIIKSDK